MKAMEMSKSKKNDNTIVWMTGKKKSNVSRKAEKIFHRRFSSKLWDLENSREIWSPVIQSSGGNERMMRKDSPRVLRDLHFQKGDFHALTVGYCRYFAWIPWNLIKFFLFFKLSKTSYLSNTSRYCIRINKKICKPSAVTVP